MLPFVISMNIALFFALLVLYNGGIFESEIFLHKLITSVGTELHKWNFHQNHLYIRIFCQNLRFFIKWKYHLDDSHILKMACYTLRRLAIVTLVNQYKALKEIDGCQSKEIWCGQKHTGFTLVEKRWNIRSSWREKEWRLKHTRSWTLSCING